ncbi:RNA-directed DNA polymerase, eukaryota, reverse transcriptase zinc-binding domain protein [Tanacetum coccineum]
MKLKFNLLDTKAENNQLVDQDLFDRISFKKELDDLDHAIRLDLMQKFRIHGIYLNGSWVLDPPIIINHIREFHKNKFSNTYSNHPSFNSSLFKRLSDLEISLLDSPFSCEEIKEPVWNYGGDKSPGLDGFTFKFIKHYWDSVGKDFIDMVKNFKTDGFIPRGCNSSFIALVPKIQDPIHTTDYRPISLIGCQYKVIAKVLANRLLQVVGLVVSEQKPKIFSKAFQFVDDALISREWSHENAKNLCRLLRCFHLASGLKVNFSKSKIFRVGATIGETNLLPSILCCKPSSLPFTYLGLPIGANMNRSCNWKPIIDKFHNRLSSWKARSLSFGGRLTLLKYVLGAIDCGGLEIGSLLASKLAMLTKWWRRFKSESNSLWHQVITSIFASHERFETNILTPIPHSIKIGDGLVFKFWHDCWFGTSNFMTLFPRMYALETHKECLISERCVSGGLIDLSFHFWAWRRSPRYGKEKAQFDDLVNILLGFKPADVRDTWTCSLNSLNTFTVSFMRFAIDSSILVSTIDNVKWNKTLPIKINTHSWRLRKDRLPTCLNLDARGIDLDSLRCPVCNDGIESTPHLFVGCTVVADIWCMIKDWWGLICISNDIDGLLSWHESA